MRRTSSMPGRRRGGGDVDRPSPATPVLRISFPANLRRTDGSFVAGELRYLLVRSPRGQLIIYGIQMITPHGAAGSAPILQPPL
jgi:hypothetical protein